MKQLSTFKKNIDPSLLSSLIGCKVSKCTGKPFKSRSKVGTIQSIKAHSITGLAAFVMKDDQTEVEAFRCVLLDS